jgi:Asp/Glu/hydantoin racemase
MTQHRKILVINPASNEAMTQRIDDSLQALRFSGGPQIVCHTLRDGPKSIGSQSDVDGVAPLVRARIATDNEASAFVIACYADPGLNASREATARPVFGIAESGILTALARANSFGVIAVRTTSIPRHMRSLRQMGVTARLAGERGLDLSAQDGASDERTFDRLCAVGRALHEIDGAEAVVIGCAGLGSFRAPLEQALGVAVIEPTQAAVAMALAAVAT